LKQVGGAFASTSVRADLKSKFCAVFAGAVLSLAVLAPAFAQDAASARYPETGIAILDCDPGDPAPADSCIVHLPPNMERGELRVDGDADFTFVQQGNSAFPRDLNLSATMILIDTTPGLRGARRAVFNQERQIIIDFLSNLPRGEQVALYGFSDRIERLVDFTTEREQLIEVVEAMRLSGDNTRIRSSILDAISVLETRDDVLLKNLIIMTDGAEEGIEGADEIAQAAVAADIPISAVGLEWRAIGVERTATAQDYLERITDAASGETVMVRVRRADEAQTEVRAFAERLRASRRGSGLILPNGDAKSAEIIVELIEPLPGSSTKQTKEVRVQFEPAQGDTPEPTEPEEAEPEENMIFGLPSMAVYAIAAGLALLLLLLIIFLSRKGKSEPEGEAIDEDDLDFGEDHDDGDDDAKTRMVRPASAPAIAYIVNAQTGERLPVSSERSAIGRSKSNAITIRHDSISRVHAEVHRNRDGGFSITDMDSLNGTTDLGVTS